MKSFSVRARFIYSLERTMMFALSVLLILLVPAVGSKGTAFIRVNQLGYEVGALDRAYLMAAGSESGAVFHVIDSAGTAVVSRPVGPKLGTWGNFNVYALDFNLSVAGVYKIDVDGPFPGLSPNFRIGPPEQLYAQGLNNALSFYQNERDGQHFVRSPLRTAAAHLHDARASAFESPQFDSNDLILNDLEPTGVTIDASGGWWDAGDYLKFVETHSYTVSLMLIGVRDFPDQMGASADGANFADEAMFGLQWLRKMWDDDTRTLYYQVGIGTDFLNNPNLLSDHDLWRLPQVDDTLGGNDPSLRYVRNRPVFVAGHALSKISPNLAGRLAAAFAGCYQVFHESQPRFADDCLVAAEHVFALADTSPSGNLLTTAPFDFYGETEWRDDMELGATELYFALAKADGPLPSGLLRTDSEFYLRAATHWARAYITGPNDASDTLNLYDVSGLAHFELFRAISDAGHPSGLEVSQTELLRDLRKELQNAVNQAASDPFGFGFPWDTFDTATHGAGLAVEAREYALLTKSQDFDGLSRRWAANILGANAWGSSFIVGAGQIFPNCMQHQVSNIVGSLNGKPPILAGALVEGPNSFSATGFVDGMRVCPGNGSDDFAPFNGNASVYRDEQESYSTVEPAIDLTAASFLMFAWRTAGAPTKLLPSEDYSGVLGAAPLAAASAANWPGRRTRARRRGSRIVRIAP